ALLTVHEHGKAPGRDAAVELHPIGFPERLPERAAVHVDELVGDDATVVGGRRRPADVAGGIPLVPLGVLVEAPDVGLGDLVGEGEGRGEGRGNIQRRHGRPPGVTENRTVQFTTNKCLSSPGAPVNGVVGWPTVATTRSARGRPRDEIGAHVSIAGGLPLALERAAALGCGTAQIFVKSHRQWAARALLDSEVRAFAAARRRTGLRVVFGHASYLVNLAAPAAVAWRHAVDAFTDEVERAEALGLACMA